MAKQHAPTRHPARLGVGLALLLAACGGGGGGGGPAGGDGSGSGQPFVEAVLSAPVIAITQPSAEGTYLATTASVTLAGTAGDDKGVAEVSWRSDVGGSGTATLGGTPTAATWSSAPIALQPGANTLTVSVRDSSGHVTSTYMVVRLGTSVGTTYYLSPTGSDAADCRSQGAACKSFASVFSKMAGGDELVLLDGTYSAAVGTGTMNWADGPNSAQPPSGTSTRGTYIHALHPGNVTVQGPLFIGRSDRKDSYITLRGLSFEGGGSLYNTSFITIKDCGFHGALDIGTNDHDQGNTDNLIEDVWVWASGERVIAINYRAHRTVWRRVVVRGDGCGTDICANSGAPNVGFTVYDSHDVSVQNVLVVDRVLAPTDTPYADFAVASHTGGLYTFGRNEWLGTISLNAPDQGYYMEPDPSTTEDPTVRVSNAVAWNAVGDGFNLARDGTNNVLENLTLSTRNTDALRVAPELATLGGTLRNVIVQGSGRYAINSAYRAAYVSVAGVWADGAFNQTQPVNIVAADARANGSLKYLTRIEAGSVLKGAGALGGDIGANVLYRYGTDGTHQGQSSYDTLRAEPLWPWPNEDRIKREMCALTSRGFCSAGKRLDGVNPVTLTSYVWEALGNPMPAGVYP